MHWNPGFGGRDWHTLPGVRDPHDALHESSHETGPSDTLLVHSQKHYRMPACKDGWCCAGTRHQRRIASNENWGPQLQD